MSEIRIGQLITPFGPGSLYTDKNGSPLVIAGLDFWFRREDQDQGFLPEDEGRTREDFYFDEPRLARLLDISEFRKPPDFRSQSGVPNRGLTIPVHRFPTWYKDKKTSKMRTFRPDQRRLEKGKSFQAIRFISVCAAGHLNEFPWKEWIGCSCQGDGNLTLTDTGASTLDAIRVRCTSCPKGSTGDKGRNLAGTTTRPSPENDFKETSFCQAGIACQGGRPWLGPDASEHGCDQQLVAALINQTNLYIPRTESGLALPDLSIEDDEVKRLRSLIEKLEDEFAIKLWWRKGKQDKAVKEAVEQLSEEAGIKAEPVKVEEALESLFDQKPVASGFAKPAEPEAERATFRREEYNILRDTFNDPGGFSDLSIIRGKVPEDLKGWLDRVCLVEKLKEVRAFAGFDRLEPENIPEAAVGRRAIRQLFKDEPDPDERWLPAIEIFGEGIFIELQNSKIVDWQESNKAWLRSRLGEDFINRLKDVYQVNPPSQPTSQDWQWASRFMLVHTFAHILINQLVFECGYSTASLRERIFVSDDQSAPMSGLLIYTAAGDSEGTLGGLVRLGLPDRLGPVIERALTRATWCSADPVCSESPGATGSRLANLSACHGCVLLPETSCETINHGLDRTLVVGGPRDRSVSFFQGFPGIF